MLVPTCCFGKATVKSYQAVGVCQHPSTSAKTMSKIFSVSYIKYEESRRIRRTLNQCAVDFLVKVLCNRQRLVKNSGYSPETIDGGDGERHHSGKHADNEDGYAHHPDDLHL